MHIILFLVFNSIALCAMLPEVPAENSLVLDSIALDPINQSTHISKPDSIELRENYRAHNTKELDTMAVIKELQRILEKTAKSEFKIEDVQHTLSHILRLRKKHNFHLKSWDRNYPTMLASIQLIIDFEKLRIKDEFSGQTMNRLLNCYTVKETLKQTDRLVHL